jgi:hypothetical protein
MVTITEEDLKQLHDLVLNQKLSELFEEPSSYEDECDDYF